MSEEQPSGKRPAGKKLVEGLNFAVYTLVVIAIIVVVNWFTNQHDHRWDLTPNHQFSLSPASIKFLHGIRKPVVIYYFGPSQEFGSTKDLLSSYRVASRHLTVDYVDPDRDPRMAREFGVRRSGSIVVVSGDRHFTAQSSSEQGVTNALIRVLKGKRTVCFLQGHGEASLTDTERGGFSQVKAALGDESYFTQTLMLMQNNSITPDCKMVVSAGPRTDYTQPEIDTIQKYVENGGRALFMIDPGVNLPNISKLLGSWGATPQNDLAIDLNPVAQMFGGRPYMPIVLKYGTSAIVEPFNRNGSVIMTMFPLAQSFDLTGASAGKVTTQWLCQTSPNSFGVTDWTPKITKISYQPGKDPKGPLMLAVSGEIGSTGGTNSEGRFIAVGTSEWATNGFLDLSGLGNRDLFMNMVNWLAAESDLISIGPKPKEHQHLTVNKAQMSRIFYLGVIGLPLAVILIGASVWWHRR